MKIGIISDIHSNIDALKKVFEKFKEEDVEKIICIGDVIGIGPYPEKCLDYLIENEKMFLTFVSGNHERYILNGLPKRNHNDDNASLMTDEERNSHYWNHARINKKQIEFIKKLKNKDCLKVEDKKIIVEHYPMGINGKFKKFRKIPTEEEIVELFDDKTADVYLFGHTHEKYYCEIAQRYYINPGSLGCPKGTNGANAGILEIHNKHIKYQQLNVKYDINKVIKDIEILDYPLCENMIDCFYIKKTN